MKFKAVIHTSTSDNPVVYELPVDFDVSRFLEFAAGVMRRDAELVKMIVNIDFYQDDELVITIRRKDQ